MNNKEFANNMRNSYREMIPSAGTPDEVFRLYDISIDSNKYNRTIPIQIFIPNESDKLPVILFAHGGGFVSGDFDTHNVLTRAMAIRTKSIVVSVDYSLAPEFLFPQGLEDVYDVLIWIGNNIAQYNGDETKIAVSGDSAGANIVAVVAMLTRDRKGPKISAQWLMYPCLSNKMDTSSWLEFGDTYFPTKDVFDNCLKCYIPSDTDKFNPYIAPLWGKHENLPPTLLQVGELDPLRDENIQYNEALKNAGISSDVIVYEQQTHGFIQFFKDHEKNKEGERALNEGVNFIVNIFNNL